MQLSGKNLSFQEQLSHTDKQSDCRHFSRDVYKALQGEPACGDPATFKADYRFFDNDDIPAEAILASHVQTTDIHLRSGYVYQAGVTATDTHLVRSGIIAEHLREWCSEVLCVNRAARLGDEGLQEGAFLVLGEIGVLPSAAPI